MTRHDVVAFSHNAHYATFGRNASKLEMIDLDRIFTSLKADDIVVCYSYSIKGCSIAETSVGMTCTKKRASEIISCVYLRLLNTLSSIGVDSSLVSFCPISIVQIDG